MDKFGIEESIFDEIINLMKKEKSVKMVKLFGSRARGDYSNASDIDLAIYFGGNSDKLRIIRELDEIRCILKFDVIDMCEITNKKLIENINKDGIIIFKR